MEVTLHRTRSLLGEKVIHLRHLEQSLDRVANARKSESEATPGKNEDMTLSDMSSASSGFSSTDIGNETFLGDCQLIRMISFFHEALIFDLYFQTNPTNTWNRLR